jgi:hypothetical protein
MTVIDFATGEIDRRPKYVRQLDHERRQDEAELTVLHARLAHLAEYLNSSKFRAPSERQNLVNVDDVLTWLDQATSAALTARSEVM